jgi:hypothetical protein
MGPRPLAEQVQMDPSTVAWTRPFEVFRRPALSWRGSREPGQPPEQKRAERKPGPLDYSSGIYRFPPWSPWPGSP